MQELLQLEIDLHETTNALAELSDALKTSAIVEANTRSDYEDAKNKLLLTLYDEEIKDGKKRTEQIRTAIYRSHLQGERRAWLLAKADMDSNRDLLKGLLSKIDSLRTLISLAKAQMELA